MDAMDLATLQDGTIESTVEYKGMALTFTWRPELYTATNHNKMVGLRREPEMDPMVEALAGTPDVEKPAEYHINPNSGEIERDAQGNPLVKVPATVKPGEPGLLVGWDLVWNGSPMPCNAQVMFRLPTRLLGAISGKIVQVVTAPKSGTPTQTNGSSSETHSPLISSLAG